LELGAGTGFLSILLAQLGADVVASDLGDSDFDEEMEGERRTPLARLQANVELSE
jgi:2-polyprenyl-3-methyl-5-hydroxy-6-metoxy-1,4-benzoquinol methylase